MKKILSVFLWIFLSSALSAQTYLKVMSYNIRQSLANDHSNNWCYRRGASERMIQTERPAIMGLQEACPEQLQFLDSVLVNYKHIGVGRDDGILEGETMAIYYDTSLFDLVKWGTFWLSETPEKVSFGWDAACRRTCTWSLMKLRSNGRKIAFFNTHLDHVGHVARREEVKLIALKVKELIDTLDIPVILTADFNTPADNPIFAPLKDVMLEARSSCAVTDRRNTFNNWGKTEGGDVNSDGEECIDHIFYRGVKGLEFKVLTQNFGAPYISDHYPITCDFYVEGQ